MNHKLISPFFENVLIQQARTWLGTPFHHQGRLKGIGCDCLGLIVGVVSELDLKDIQGKPLSLYDEATYSKDPDGGYLVEKLSSLLVDVPPSKVVAGDLALFQIKGNPQHLGLITDYKNGLGLLHAYAPSRRVVEHEFDQFWKKQLIKVFRWPQLPLHKPHNTEQSN
jgi:NlpC/P60 family putative phage cell wall peptidase